MKRYTDQPRFCAACYGQNIDRGVDFEAAYDGPVVNQIAVVTSPGVDAIAIDDLVICDNCLTAAAKVIGLVNAPDLKDELERVKLLNEAQAQALADTKRALGDMHVAHRALVIAREGRPVKPENLPDPSREPVAG